jgi:hypothetical protein
MKGLVFAVTMIVLSLIMATGAVVFGQTNTPTPTTAATTTPSPTSATVPSGAPATGMGGN